MSADTQYKISFRTSDPISCSIRWFNIFQRFHSVGKCFQGIYYSSLIQGGEFKLKYISLKGPLSLHSGGALSDFCEDNATMYKARVSGELIQFNHLQNTRTSMSNWDIRQSQCI